ncbi:MAG TPA: hypothetical protein VGB53_03120 [Rubricoccaceae bacterium]|jgi:hypothetical protein
MTLRLACLCLALLAGCSTGPVDVQTAESVPLRLDRAGARRLAESVLGGYAGRGVGPGADRGALASGLVTGEGDDLTLHPQLLAPDIRTHLRDADGDGSIGWPELSAFLAATYATGHGLPPTLAALRVQSGLPESGTAADTAMFSVDIEGSVMTHARRRVSVPLAALRSAISSFAAGDGLRYPAGTLILGEHLGSGADGEAVLETTVKRRRADGFWDFAVYDAQGRITSATATPPRPLRSPTQCTGCHLGQRLFEPERSYPATPTASADGPRRYDVPDAWRSAAATERFGEHARRDDGVLGLYATVYTGRLIAARTAGEASAADLALLSRLGL